MYNIVHPEVIPALVVFTREFLNFDTQVLQVTTDLLQNLVALNYFKINELEVNKQPKTAKLSQHISAINEVNNTFDISNNGLYSKENLKQLLSVKNESFEFKTSDTVIENLFVCLQTANSNINQLINKNIKNISDVCGCQSQAIKNLYLRIISVLYGTDVNQDSNIFEFKQRIQRLMQYKLNGNNPSVTEIVSLINSLEGIQKQKNISDVSSPNNSNDTKIEVYKFCTIETKTSFNELLLQLPENYIRRVNNLYAEYLNTIPTSKIKDNIVNLISKQINNIGYTSAKTKEIIIRELKQKLQSDNEQPKSSLCGVIITYDGKYTLTEKGNYTMHFSFEDFLKYRVRYERSPIDGSKLKIVEI